MLCWNVLAQCWYLTAPTTALCVGCYPCERTRRNGDQLQLWLGVVVKAVTLASSTFPEDWQLTPKVLSLWQIHSTIGWYDMLQDVVMGKSLLAVVDAVLD
mmetsp:Transcript_63808/g.152172  ORF Transcript_63808/g.152172 Transcript_63808/m.152172 type:complete len:100 (-) Transcript_63808:284-583(-)